MINTYFEQYHNYVDSGLEWIDSAPSHWPKSRFKDVIAKLESGVSVNATDEPVEGDNIGVLKTSCVGKGKFLPNENKSVWPTEIERVCVPVKAGRIIISRMNTPQLVGASEFITTDYPNLFLPDRLWQTVFLPNVKLNSKWLSLLMGSSAFRFLLSTLGSGTSPSMKSLGQEKLLNIRFAFPPLHEQEAIAVYLDAKATQIDHQVVLLSQKAEMYGILKNSIIKETVTSGLNKDAKMKPSGVEWLGEVPEHWKVRRIVDIVTQNKQKNYGSFEKNLLSLSYGRLIRKDYETSIGLLPESFESYQIVKKGNIILRLTDLQNDQRSLRVGLAREQGIITSAYLGLCFHHSINPSFAYYLLHVYDLCKVFYWFGGGLRSTMRFDDIKIIPFVIPPPDEQQLIADHLANKTEQIDRIVATIRNKIVRLKELRKSLINDVIAGKIKVVSERRTS